MSESTSDTALRVALTSIALVASGDRADFDAVIAPDAVNHESSNEPPRCRSGGPSAFYETALWLRSAFAGLEHRVEHTVVGDDGLVVVDVTMVGRHVGPFALYSPDAELDSVQAPTGRSFEARQTHWIRVVDGLVTEHWAVRDDLGQAFQLGWLPPTPAHLVRSARAKRGVTREARVRSAR